MEKILEPWTISKATSEDTLLLWNWIDQINKQRKKITIFEDSNECHTKQTLGKLLENENDYECIYLLHYEKKIVGFLDMQYRASDYLFFDDKYVYIRYIYIEGVASVESQKLVKYAMQEAKKYEFHFICGDLISEDESMERLLEKNEFKRFRLRVVKKLV